MRNIRTVIATTWRRDPEFLVQWGSAQSFPQKPVSSRFLYILVERMSS